jgi:hypothetical protein
MGQRMSGTSNGKPNGTSAHEPPDSETESSEDVGSIDEPVDIPEDLSHPPARVLELAAACVRFVQGKYGVPLDFTSETLSLVDQYVRDARKEILLLPSSGELISLSIGAYLGEVLRRTFGAEWEAEGEPSTYRLCFSNVYMWTNPIGMAREALTSLPEDGWNAHLSTRGEDRIELEARLKSLPEVDEDEFYLPTTRFDSVHIAFESLRARAIARGESAKRYRADDYR